MVCYLVVFSAPFALIMHIPVFMVWFALYVSFFPHSHILRFRRCNLKTERIYFNININKQTASIINLKTTLSGHKSICRYLSVPFLFSLCLYLSLLYCHLISFPWHSCFTNSWTQYEMKLVSLLLRLCCCCSCCTLD